jgi:hypothetical protein
MARGAIADGKVETIETRECWRCFAEFLKYERLDIPSRASIDDA